MIDIRHCAESQLWFEVCTNKELFAKRNEKGFFALLNEKFEYTREQIDFLIKEMNK